MDHKPKDIRYERDVQAELAAKSLEKYYAQNGEQKDKYQAFVTSHSGRKIPVNMIILSVILLIAIFQFAIQYHNALVKILPLPLKEPFLKHIQPFIDVNDGYGSKELPPEEISTLLSDTKPTIQNTNPPGYVQPPIEAAQQEYVQIKGRYYKYNPDNLYIVDGEKIFYLDSRRKK